MSGGPVGRTLPQLDRWAPGLPALLHYDRANLGSDIRAGLAVAAVAVPVGIAYAGLAGFRPEIGLYASLFPLLAYAVFGSSRQLIVGPDAATCAVIAASVAPLAGADPARYAALAGMLTLLAGLICIAASLFRLGALADFLSRPILVGLLNGIGITIMLGQVGKLLGFTVTSHGFIPLLAEVSDRIGETHLPTLLVGLAALAVAGLSPRLAPALPAAIVVMVTSALAVALLQLNSAGVDTLGVVPGGLPLPSFPAVDWAAMPDLLVDAGGLALVSFTSLIFTARSFASKNSYEVNADQEFAALGASNIVAAFTHGFAVSGADSRTAVADAAGGRTHMAGLVAAAAVAVVLLFFTWPLRFVPVAALGAVLVFAGLSLLNLRTLRLIWQADRLEAAISVLATAGVIGLGVTRGVLLAVVLAVLRFIQLSARPSIEELGRVEGFPGFHSLTRHAGAHPTPGVVILRCNGPLVFFNAGYFRKECMSAIAHQEIPVEAVILDLLPVTKVDVSGMFELKEIATILEGRGIRLVGAGRQTEWARWRSRRGFTGEAMPIYPTLRQAAKELSALPKPDAANDSPTTEPRT
ncbi:SulP family inorganic anion transporter [Mesorhizobium sp. ANAO-SY3R2]|uniref:SulP family inorganic anion transporter n=1 Tax=Mesorhizobium sp. ANAO-SY3R2 TaxID=3166644 RepID=UPI00366D7953